MRNRIKAIVIIDVATSALMAVVAVVSGSRYGTLLIWSGILIVMIGAMSAAGSENVQGEYNLKFDQKIPQANYHKTDNKLGEIEKSYDFGVLMTVSGAVLIAVGLVVNKFFQA